MATGETVCRWVAERIAGILTVGKRKRVTRIVDGREDGEVAGRVTIREVGRLGYRVRERRVETRAIEKGSCRVAGRV